MRYETWDMVRYESWDMRYGEIWDMRHEAWDMVRYETWDMVRYVIWDMRSGGVLDHKPSRPVTDYSDDVWWWGREVMGAMGEITTDNVSSSLTGDTVTDLAGSWRSKNRKLTDFDMSGQRQRKISHRKVIIHDDGDICNRTYNKVCSLSLYIYSASVTAPLPAGVSLRSRSWPRQSPSAPRAGRAGRPGCCPQVQAVHVWDVSTDDDGWPVPWEHGWDGTTAGPGNAADGRSPGDDGSSWSWWSC